MATCDICILEFKEHNLVGLGCCTFKCCLDCMLKCKDKCPQCRKESYWTTTKHIQSMKDMYKHKLDGEIKKHKLAFNKLHEKNELLVETLNQYRQNKIDELNNDQFMRDISDVIQRYNLQIK